MKEMEFKFEVKSYDIKNTIAMLLFFQEKGIEYKYDIDYTSCYTLARLSIVDDLITPADFKKIFGKDENLFDNLLEIQQGLRDYFQSELECYEQDHPEWEKIQKALVVNTEQYKKIIKFKELVFS